MNTASAPPLSDDLDTLPRRLRLPHVRRLAPEVLATLLYEAVDTEPLRS